MGTVRGAPASGSPGVLGWRSRLRVMGLEPSPELVAIGMGALLSSCCACRLSRSALLKSRPLMNAFNS